jgi:RNA polymerase sigma factor (sigma-70 family)
MLRRPEAALAGAGAAGRSAAPPDAPAAIALRARAADPDAALVALAQRGDAAAFEELVRRHADRLYVVVLRVLGHPEDAEEVAQEAFLRAWRGIRRFNGGAGFYTWLYRIGVNEAFRRMRRRPSQGIASIDEDGVDPADLRAAPDRAAEQGDLRAALERAVRVSNRRMASDRPAGALRGLAEALAFERRPRAVAEVPLAHAIAPFPTSSELWLKAVEAYEQERRVTLHAAAPIGAAA